MATREYTAALGFSGSSGGRGLCSCSGIDAVVDPFFGSWSDNIRSRFDRRIPLMIWWARRWLALSVGMLFACRPPGLSGAW